MLKKHISCAALLISLIFILSGCKSSDYKKAVSYYDSGNYVEAYAIFKTYSGYKDVDQYIANIRESGVVIRNAEVENEIGKKLYGQAKQYANGLTSAAASVGISGARVAEYEMVKDQTVDVRFDELSNKFAAVIEVRWAYELFGKTTWHSYHCTYTGTYVDTDLNIVTSEKYEDKMTSKQIEAFWAENWEK